MKAHTLSPMIIIALLGVPEAHAQLAARNIFQATVGEAGAKTLEVSTEELRDLLAAGGVVLLDTRPEIEWATGHIPGAINVAPAPRRTASQHMADVAEVRRLLKDEKDRLVILYCNGAFCGKSKRLADELSLAGFSNVRRYQLGAPIWRALGGVMVIEPSRLSYVYQNDRTAVWIDARDPASYAAATISGARNLPRSRLLPGKDAGEVTAAKDDGRLPMHDHNTRIIVFGADAAEARAVAEGIARGAFHNVSYFEGTFEALREAMKTEN